MSALTESSVGTPCWMDAGDRLTVSHSVARYLRDLYKEAGFNVESIYRDYGVDAQIFDKSPHGRFSYEVTSLVWNRVANSSHDRHLGLHLGNRARFVPTNLIYHLMSCADSLGAAIKVCYEFQSMVSDALQVELSVEDGRAQFIFDLIYVVQPPHRQQLDFWLSNLVRHFSSLTSDGFDPLEVHFQYERPNSTREYGNVLNCKTQFGQKHNAIIFPAEQLRLPIPTSNREVFGLIKEEAQTIKKSFCNGGVMSVQLTRELLREIRDNGSLTSDINKLAKRLNIAVRTMQRRLSDEGTNFNAMLDGIKRDVALSRLSQTRLPISEIAYSLGYSDVSTFYRAFRRWAGGFTPSDYRHNVGLH